MRHEVNIGIDEFTLVAQGDKSRIGTVKQWKPYAMNICNEIAERAKLTTLFGSMNQLDNLPQGYQIGYKFGDNPFYFALAFHPDYFQMGVIIKFSAYAWMEYKAKWQDQYGSDMNIVNFLKLLPQKNFKLRLSRVDFTVDYFNYAMSVDELYKSIENETNRPIDVLNYQGYQNNSKLSAVVKDGIVSTFYLGSKKANVNALLRVYDKKVEQISKTGIYYQKAIASDSWVRFEAVFKGIYAHQLTDILFSTIQSKDDLIQLIIDKISEKYSFWYADTQKPIEFTAELLRMSQGFFPPLSAKSPRDNDLARSVTYLRRGSGLYPILYKVQDIWGNDAVIRFLNLLIEDYANNYEPNKDVQIWLNKRRTLMKQTAMSELFLEIWGT